MLNAAADTTNLFRPNQVEEARDELRKMDNILSAPPHIRGKVSDPGLMSKRRKRLAADLEKYEPKPFGAAEKDAALAEFQDLGAAIKAGMPSSEEMRRNSPGCVNKHLGWEQRNKKTIARWKNIGLRLAAGGDVRSDLAQSADVINIEILRERATNRDLSMDNAQIPKTAAFHFGADPVGTVLFSDAETATLAEISPAVAGSLAILGNAERAEIKAILERAMAPATQAAAPTADAKVGKPEIRDLTFNEMKSLAARNGMKEAVGSTKSALIGWLRAHHLIR